MPSEERSVTIRSWPGQPVRLAHAPSVSEPVPVSVSFGKGPVGVEVATSAQQPLRVEMPTALRAREPVPVCIAICEPVCAESDYTIGLRLFDEMVMGIRVRGRTVIDACDRGPVRPRPRPERDRPDDQERCLDFRGLHVGHVFPNPLPRADNEALVSSGAGGVRITDLGLPAAEAKAEIPEEGLEIEFAHAISRVRMVVSNLSGPGLTFEAYSGSTRLLRREEPIVDTTAEVALAAEGITSVRILGSRGESSLVEVCFR